MGLFNITASAYTSGDYTYIVSDGKATITDFDASVIGAVSIPSDFDGYPVVSIGDYAFFECASITSVSIPSGVTSIGTAAFRECTSLVSVSIPESVSSIGVYAFQDCSMLASVSVPKAVTKISKAMFSRCTSLKTVKLYGNITTVEDDAFYYCSSLENIYIPDISAWCNMSFSNSYSNPMYYAENLYVSDVLLTDLVLPSGMQMIDEGRFSNIKTIENVWIPESVVLIRQKAFYSCSGIKNVYYEGSSDAWTQVVIDKYNDKLTDAALHYNSVGINASVTKIEITTLPDKLKYIENSEDLDLSGGVLTVYYDNGSTTTVDLSSLEAEDFDNSKLGVQTITVRYGEFSTQLKIEIIARPISFVAVASLPQKTEYIEGEELDVLGGKIAVGYPEGDYELFDITTEMVTGFDKNKPGYQIVSVTYKGQTTQLTVVVFEKADFDRDGVLGASDIATLKKELLSSAEYAASLDVNCDGALNIIDLIKIKKLAAGQVP